MILLDATDVHDRRVPSPISQAFAQWANRNGVGDAVAYELLDESGRHLMATFLVECACSTNTCCWRRPNGRHVVLAHGGHPPARYRTHVVVADPIPLDALPYITAHQREDHR